MFEKFIILPHENKGEEIFIQMAGISYCDGSYRINRDRINTYVLEAIELGEGVLIVDNESYYPKAGDCYLVPSQSNHCYYSDSKNPWTKYWFNLSGNGVQKLLEAYDINNVIHFKNCNLAELFKSALLELENLDYEKTLDVGVGLISRIIRQLSHIYKSQNIDTPKFSNDGVKLKNYLDNQVRNSSPDLAVLSKLINKSPAQTLRIFKHDFGISPIAYLIDKKINIAKNLLSKPSLSVKEVANILGFHDEFYFSRLFKDKCGISPLLYKKQNINS